MKAIRKSGERGATTIDWLDSKHTFSFGSYFDPNFMGFHTLRVINDDRVKPGAGFGAHGHANMEIISYVVEGALEHKDSLGTGSVIRPGEVQKMSAGRGIRHSEYNASKVEPVRFLQIWIPPNEMNVEPSYEQKTIPPRSGEFVLIVSPDGKEGSVTVHQDAWIYRAVLNAGDEVSHTLGADRKVWLQVVKGQLDVDGDALVEGDGLAMVDETSMTLRTDDHAEVLLFELA
ncbi:MAG: pirin family protein [bacterium]